MPLAEAPATEPPADRDCLYDGIAGLAPVLAEVRLAREWSADEQALADGVVARPGPRRHRRRLEPVRRAGRMPRGRGGSWTGASPTGSSNRLAGAATPTGWLSPVFGEPVTPVNDLLMGAAGIVLTLLLARGNRGGAPGRYRSGRTPWWPPHGPAAIGVEWKMFEGDRDRLMPNYSHGTAGVAAALAVAGRQGSGAQDLVEARAASAPSRWWLGPTNLTGEGFRACLCRFLPPRTTKTSATAGATVRPAPRTCYGALAGRGGGGRSRSSQTRVDGPRLPAACRPSGIPDRRYPGFWDNDGRCCGTAGVLDAVLDHFQATGAAEEKHRSSLTGSPRRSSSGRSPARPSPTTGYWRFYEHRLDQP